VDQNQVLPKELFKDKTVFITGGASGINYGIAESFAKLSANIAICGRTKEKLDEAKAKLESDYKVRVFAEVADVRDYESLSSIIKKTEEELGTINSLICGAAGNFICPAEMMTANGFKTVIDIDLNGSFNACRASFEQLKKTSGNIIFISAGQAYIPYYAQIHVGAAKAGIDNLMKNLAMEWGPYGIRSNSIAPGPIEGTEGMKRMAPGNIGKELTKSIPLQRMGKTEDIGNAAVFLSSSLASYITGTLLVVDGGQNLPGSGLFAKMIMENMDQFQ
jgi:NAD(P)-dependent dehydrogenase (short-subunit alcohol dehydrogenase family)